MTRRLSKDERALWDRLRETVKPLKRGVKKARAALETLATPEGETQAHAKPQPRPARTKAGSDPAKPARQETPPPPPALAPLEEKTLRRLARGLAEIDARIDLHGMRQERAFNALSTFLRRQQASGARIVLVVTGKGRVGGEGRGVLRESVPHWLSRGDLRNLVVGFEEAHRRHGGGGALYVRIRRRREGGREPGR